MALAEQADLEPRFEGAPQQIAHLAVELLDALGGLDVRRVAGGEEQRREGPILDDVRQRRDDLLAELHLRCGRGRIIDLDAMDPRAQIRECLVEDRVEHRRLRGEVQIERAARDLRTLDDRVDRCTVIAGVGEHGLRRREDLSTTLQLRPITSVERRRDH